MNLAWERAQSFFSRGEYKAALEDCSRVISGSPGFPGGHWLASRIHQIETRFRLAVFHARQAARSLTRDSPEIERLLVCRRLISTGEYKAARDILATLEVGRLLEPSMIAETCELFAMLDEPASTLQWLEAAERMGARSSDLSYLKANAFKFIGRFDDANTYYEEAVEQNLLNSHAHLALATLGSRGRELRVGRMMKVIASLEGSGRGAESTPFRFALFKELDAMGDTATAWSQLEIGLREQRARVGAAPGTHARIFAHAERAMDSLLFETHGSYEREVMPIFILGMPRTGTTVVERILGNHPDVEACGELSEFRMAYKWVSDYFCRGLLDEHAASLMRDINQRDLGQIYLDAIQWRAKGRRWITDKHPGNLIFLALIAASIPGAKLIHVSRAPMDSCFSNLKELFADGYYTYSYGFEDVAEYYNAYQHFMRKVCERVPAGRILHIDYEEMVSNPARTALELTTHIGIPSVMGIEHIERNHGAVTTASSVQVRSAIGNGNISAWKRYERELAPLLNMISIH